MLDKLLKEVPEELSRVVRGESIRMNLNIRLIRHLNYRCHLFSWVERVANAQRQQFIRMRQEELNAEEQKIQIGAQIIQLKQEMLDELAKDNPDGQVVRTLATQIRSLKADIANINAGMPE